MNYVIITPARNAAKHIEFTLNSMSRQSVPPLQWIVVNDGSTDETREILRVWQSRLHFLRVVDVTPEEKRNFASKVAAFQRGYAECRDWNPDLIGNLDADMTLPNEYFERLIAQFEYNKQLGIGSGVYADEMSDGSLSEVSTPEDYCPGALQLFRRECLEAIGGYPPLAVGGIDTAAVLIAKMKGWEVRSFPQLKTIHHGRKELSFRQTLRTRFREGLRDHCLGMHWAYAMAKMLKRLNEQPKMIGASWRMLGYLRACASRTDRPLPQELVDFIQREELAKLRGMFNPARRVIKRTNQ